MEQDFNLLPRDKLLRDSFTQAETLLFAVILLTANFTFWLADPRSFWLLGGFLIAAGMTPVILKTHEQTHPFFITFLWPKFWLCTAPVWLFLLQFIAGLPQDPINSVILKNEAYPSLETIHPWLPVSTKKSTTWLTVLGYGSIYLVAINLFIVPKSRAYFERLLPWLCISSALVAIYGYAQAGFEPSAPLFTKGTGQADFFGFFPYDGHWAAFATIWTCINMSMALLVTRYDDSPAFIESTGPWYLSAGILFGSSAFLVEAHWPAVILMLTLSVMLLLFSLNFLSNRKDPHHTALTIFSGLASTAIFAAGLFRIFQNPVSSTNAEAIRAAALEIFKDSPIFGWGMDSYAELLPYYGSDLITGQNYTRAGNDFTQFLAELGIVGVSLPIIVFMTLLIRYFRGRHDIQLTNHLLIGCAAVLALAFFDTPLMSPAVSFSLLIAFFTALRWADLSRNKTDEVDSPKPVLVTPESKRRVPFFSKPANDRLR